jgi:uncharacterized protein (DUF433 family)
MERDDIWAKVRKMQQDNPRYSVEDILNELRRAGFSDVEIEEGIPTAAEQVRRAAH